jgi:hypothetical protein
MKHDFFTIKGLAQSAFAEILNPDGRVKVETPAGASGLTDLELRAASVPVEQVSGSMWSTVAQQSGTWDIGTVTTVTGITNSVAVSLTDSSGVGYSGSNRLPTRPINARGSLATAYVSLTTGTETTLLAGTAGEYRDLIYIMGTNNSDVAVSVDIRNVTAGNIQTTVRIPANGTAGVSLPVPIPQEETGNNWTADLPDITGTTVTLSALFSKEV